MKRQIRELSNNKRKEIGEMSTQELSTMQK